MSNIDQPEIRPHKWNIIYKWKDKLMVVQEETEKSKLLHRSALQTRLNLNRKCTAAYIQTGHIGDGEKQMRTKEEVEEEEED